VRYLRQALVGLSIGLSFLSALGYVLDLYVDGQKPPPPRPRKVCFVPLGSFPEEQLAELKRHYENRLGLTVETVAPIQLEPSVVNTQRRQVIAEELIALIRRTHPVLANDFGVAIIGVTTEDMYIRSLKWRFAFAYREEDRFARIAVVSSARMDPAFHGDPPDIARREARFRKVVTKNIGLMYYHLPPSRDRRSVMFGRILGLDDLDRVREDLEVRS